MKRFHFKVLFMALFTAIFLASIPLFCIVSNAYVSEENLVFLVAAKEQEEGTTVKDSKGGLEADLVDNNSEKYTVSSDGLFMEKVEAKFIKDKCFSCFNADKYTIEIYLQDFNTNGTDYPSALLTIGAKDAGATLGVLVKAGYLVFYANGVYHNCYSITQNTINGMLQDTLISITVDNTTSTAEFYINGAKYYSVTHATTIKKYSNMAFVKIGDYGSWWSTANFKTIRIYNTALTQNQIKTNYTMDRNAYAKDKDLPYYDFGYDHEGHLKAFFGGKYSISSDKKHWKNVASSGLYWSVNSDMGDNFVDANGSYHISGKRVNYADVPANSSQISIIFGNARVNDTYVQKSFTVELKLEDFTHTSTGYDYLFWLSEGSNNSYPLVIFYDKTNSRIGVKYEDWGSTKKYLYYGITEAKLKTALISLSYEQSIAFIDQNQTKKSFDNICLYVNGDRADGTNASWIRDTGADGTHFGWNNVRLGDDHDNTKLDCVFQYVRFYDIALTQEQIRQNYALDIGKYNETDIDRTRSAAYYGITGFDKIIHAPNKIGLGTTLNDNEYNELNSDWTFSNFTNNDLSNYLYSVAENGTRVNNITSSAHFINMEYAKSKDGRTSGYLEGKVRNVSYIISRVNNADISLSAIDGSYKSDNDNAVLLADNSFFLRSKYKCGAGAFNGNVAESPRLMVTADICTESVQDTDFCGMVIDYSDEIYNRFNANATQMYTAFDEDKNEDNGYAHSSLFPTGVGFSIVRKQKVGQNYQNCSDAYSYYYGTAYGVDKTKYKVKKYVQVTSNGQSVDGIFVYDSNGPKKDANGNLIQYTSDWEGYPFNKVVDVDKTIVPIDSNAGYVMRVFVGGTGKSNGSVNSKNTQYYDVPLPFELNSKTFHNYTIYRNYEQWQYVDVAGSNISANAPVYIVRFFVDKKMVAVVAMKLGENGTFANQSAEMFSVDTEGDLTLQKFANVPTFNDWARCNKYGDEGKIDENAPSPSGNILIGLHRENRFILNNGQIAEENDETLCKVYFDNIGYMDYNDPLTKDTYSSNVSLNADMTVNVRSTIAHQYPVKEPVVKFNRLAYNSSLILDSFAQGNAKLYKIPYYVKDDVPTKSTLETRIAQSLGIDATVLETLDYKASHGTSYLVGDRFLSIDGIRDKALDGIYFKDICDTLTIEVVDFNGVVIYVNDNFSVIKYFNNLYDKYKNGGNPDNMNQNQINLMLDIIELGREDHYNSGYFKMKRDEVFKFDDWQNQQDLLVDDGEYQSKLAEFEATIDTTDEIAGLINSQAMIDKYGKPSVTKYETPENGYNYSFKSYNISVKSYIGLVVKINFSGKDISKYLTITYVDDEGNTQSVPVQKLTDRATYNDGINNAFYDDVDGIVSIEIPLSFLDYDKVYTFTLYEHQDKVGGYQKLIYSLNKYCAAMWDNKTKNTCNFVKRLYHIECLSKEFNNSVVYDFKKAFENEIPA